MLVMLVMVELKLWLGLMLLLDLWPRNLVRVEFGVGGRGGKVVRIGLARYGLGARVVDDDVTLFKVLDEGMEVQEVETTAGVIAALRAKRRAIDRLATAKCQRGVGVLTSSSSRSMAGSAFMMEPRSDSMEEILPEPQRSVGLDERKE